TALKVVAKTREQRVAGGVSEHVVVLLEAVEVEQREHQRAVLAGLRELVLEIAHQCPTIGERGQRVGVGLHQRRSEQALVGDPPPSAWRANTWASTRPTRALWDSAFDSEPLKRWPSTGTAR